jgi:transcription-repair coupling factor (superfamily II helicase)
VEFDFLHRLFGEIQRDERQSFEIVEFKDIDYARLYALYRSNQSKANVTLLPPNFITPHLKAIELTVGQKCSPEQFVQQLVESNYERVEQVFQAMQFSQKGDVFIVYTNLNDQVFRVEFFGDSIERIARIDNVSFRLTANVHNLLILNFNPEEREFPPEVYGEYPQHSPHLIIFLNRSIDVENGIIKPNISLDFRGLPLFHKNEKVFGQFIERHGEYELFYTGHFWEALPEGFKTINGKRTNRLQLHINLEKGFISADKKIILITDREILSTLNLAKAKSKLSSKFTKLFENEINIGDYVVHEAHGIGVYRGIETKVVLGEVQDYVILEYLNNDKLLIPLTQLARISKYITSEGSEPRITKLGTAEWDAIKRRLKKSVEDIAGELLEIYAKKNIEKGIEFDGDTKEQFTFESEFPYPLTEDQAKTLNEVKDDMESSKPMDRLIIGDVGFGKTEIAIRAAFKAVYSGKQVLVLAPTTVLVTQLYNVFAKRLMKHRIKIARVSRFDGTERNKENIQKANDGKIDILIGTHRLLSKDVEIPNLGLLVVDEEQRFGVKQKEKLRKLRTNIDVLSMSATPIPRTLQMALTGIKDISIIATPPAGRLPVHNEVIFEDEIAAKVLLEVERNGQVFIVHNKIEDLDQFVQKVMERLPESIRIAVGHGQMTGEKLEKIMFEFQEKQYDVLIATTIIENGIDIPSVNTIIIDDAHQFGLSQLYQLRGRVGRSEVQGYCYLVLPKTKEFIRLHKNPGVELRKLRQLLDENKVEDLWITPDAISRIEAILENQELGAGFKIASRDLEIRGSGNILGAEQSGQINAVGYEMYVRLLEQEIDRIRKLNNHTLQQIEKTRQ